MVEKILLNSIKCTGNSRENTCTDVKASRVKYFYKAPKQIKSRAMIETKDTNIMKLSGCLSLSDFVRSRPFRNPCTSAARVCMETEEKNKQSLK